MSVSLNESMTAKLNTMKLTHHFNGLMALILCSAGYAQAQPPAPAPDGQTMRWGAALISLPKYPGADRQQLFAAPLIEARFGEHFFASTLQGLGADWRPADGLSLSAALVLDSHWRRRKDLPAAWASLDEVKFAPALRLAAQWQLERFSVELSSSSRLGTLSRGAAGSKNKKGGHSVQLDASYGLLATPGLALAAGVSVEAMDARLGQALFGVDASQAASSKLRVHSVRAGVASAGVFAQAQVPLDRDWNFSARMGLQSLRGDAGNSPLVQKRRQPTLAMSFSRAF